MNKTDIDLKCPKCNTRITGKVIEIKCVDLFVYFACVMVILNQYGLIQ